MLPGARNQHHRGPKPIAPLPDESLPSSEFQPSNSFDFSNVDSAPSARIQKIGRNVSVGQDHSYQQPLQSPGHQQPLASPYHQPQISASTSSYLPQPSPNPPIQYNHESDDGDQGSLHYSQNPAYPPASVPYDSHIDSRSTIPQPEFYQDQYQSRNQHEIDSNFSSHPSISAQSNEYAQYPDSQASSQRHDSHQQIPTHPLYASSTDLSQAGTYHLPTVFSHTDFSHPNYSSVQTPTHDIAPHVKCRPQPVLGMSRV